MHRQQRHNHGTNQLYRSMALCVGSFFIAMKTQSAECFALSHSSSTQRITFVNELQSQHSAGTVAGTAATARRQHHSNTGSSSNTSSSSRTRRRPNSSLHMVMSFPDRDQSSWDRADKISVNGSNRNGNDGNKKHKKKRYRRKQIPETEMETLRLKKARQAKYEEVMASPGTSNLWSFERLFPDPVLDKKSIEFDLYEIKRRDDTLNKERQQRTNKPGPKQQPEPPVYPVSAASRRKTQKPTSAKQPNITPNQVTNVAEFSSAVADTTINSQNGLPSPPIESVLRPVAKGAANLNITAFRADAIATQTSASVNASGKVDFELTRMVEDRIYGYRRGSSLYETSLMGDGAIKFREGVRLGNALPANAARLNFFAKKELRKDRVEEAQELFELAIAIDPRDGRAYLGLSKAAERRRDFKLARKWLMTGIANSISFDTDGEPDRGANPFLLQALGVLEEKKGNLAQAEALYIEAVKARPSHAAGWVALALLRTRKFRQGAGAGRICFETASKELTKRGKPQSSHVYTAWASLEYKKANDIRRARELFKKAIEVDPRCSAAWLQLGVMEAAVENWEDAQECFDTVLKFDQRNSRVLQAYAIMETKRPDPNSRKAIGLFEKALRANKRDAGVLQAYALYVAELGDIDSARELLTRATAMDKRHAPVWQAWGVLETRHGYAQEARNIFQQGIWACAQPSGGQSGGYGCARLWQAWGVLEAQQGDEAAARRCFSRALDADNRNIAAVTAWSQMEEDNGSLKDATLILERFMKQFVPGTKEKNDLWRFYELMLQRAGNLEGATDVYQRSMRESFAIGDEKLSEYTYKTTIDSGEPAADIPEVAPAKYEVETARWDSGSTSMKAEIWMNEGSIEGKVPQSVMNKKGKR